jgi:hypothetical protein
MRNAYCQARSTGLLLRRHIACCVSLFLMLSCIGCNVRSENRATIGGEVKLDGRPIERGSIQFLPMQGVAGSIANGEIVQGRYQMSGKTGPAIGWNRVEINAARKTGRMVPKPYPKRGATEEAVEAVAPSYNSASTLKFEVQPGENHADFDVASMK